MGNFGILQRFPIPIHSSTLAEHRLLSDRAAERSQQQPTTAPTAIHEGVSFQGLPAGQQLDQTTRTFMEARLGHDFSRVRVHTDTNAAASAQAVNALAYTVGNQIVFGAGQYTPATARGQRLLAHELTHVVQQTSGQVGPGGMLQRQRARPDEPTRREVAQDIRLRRLAIWPNEALYAWRRLNSGERTLVTFHMIGNYGEDFTRQFLTHANARRRRTPVHHYTNILNQTHEQLQRRGYRYVITSMGIERWVHPSGDTLNRILPSQRSAPEAPPTPETEPSATPPTTGPAEETENPPRIDPNVDPERAYGPQVQARDGAAIMGQSGRAVEYEDGTILIYPPGSRTPITYRPRPEGYGTYDYYDQTGEKAEGVIIAIDPDEVFGSGQSP